MLPGISRPGFKFLMKASRLYKDLCPEQSRFLMGRLQNIKALNSLKPRRRKPTMPEGEFCPFCCQWRRPGNHRVRLRPKRRASARVQSVLRREGRGKRLSLIQRELLRRFRKAPAVLMATCHTCNHTARSNGASRDLMATFSRNPYTPAGANKRKPPRSPTPYNMSTPKTPKDKTLFSTPRLNSKGSSGSSSSSTPASVKKSPFTHPKSFLMLQERLKNKMQERQKNKKAGLKDFLSSL